MQAPTCTDLRFHLVKALDLIRQLRNYLLFYEPGAPTFHLNALHTHKKTFHNKRIEKRNRLI